MVVNAKNYFGLDMTEWEKNIFIDGFLREVKDKIEGKKQDFDIRKYYAKLYMMPTDNNYVMSKPAQETIDKIKLSNPKKVFKMLIEKADDSGTFLLTKNSFFRYFKIDELGYPNLIGLYCERVYTDEVVEFDGRITKDYYFNYETFRIMPDDYSHPGSLEGMHNKILQFIKTLIFIKCSNVESYLIKPHKKVKPPRMKDNKWMNKSGIDVTLINADWNLMYIKTDDFAVSGHLRLQPHGRENKEVKIIWINSYLKHGYTRQYHA